ncbi:MAG: penicillin acylase family protein, partial [Pseudomonadota bacterium]
MAIAGLAAASFVVWAIAARPDYGRGPVSGAVSHEVKIYRDALGIPHIFADTHGDAMFALGYVQGQDRGWQMEFLRRAVDGRMSEIAGGSLVDLDRDFLVSGASRLADLSYASYSEQTHQAIDAFAAGINVAIREGQYTASPEFRIFGVVPEPWTGRQVGALTYLIGSTFDTSSRRVLWSEGLRRDIGDAQARQLIQDFEENWPTLYRDIGGLQETADRTRRALADAGLPETPQIVPGDVGDFEDIGRGTNFFLLGPEKTTTGAPILAVDPHVDIDAPSFYYPAAITLPDQVLRGAFWVTSPAIHFGHNRDIAWGMTGAAVDNAHYVLEKIDPSDPDAYLRPNGSRPFTFEQRDIGIKNKSQSVRLGLRYTDNGLVVSDFDEDLQALADTHGPGHVLVRKSAPLLAGQF